MAKPKEYSGNGIIVTINDPYNITKQECCALAQAGKDAWNDWRIAYPVRRPSWNFENNADFSECSIDPEQISFEGFIFDDYANFKNTIFGDLVIFKHAYFGSWSSFEQASFGNRSDFTYAKFGEYASFDCAAFGEDTHFSNTTFNDGVSFFGCSFNSSTYFDGAIFSGSARFRAAQFNDLVTFRGAQFYGALEFQVAEFGGWTSFEGAQFGSDAHFEGSQFGEWVCFAALEWGQLKDTYGNSGAARQTWAEERALDPATFKKIFFMGAIFKGKLDFSGRRFEGETNFGVLPKAIQVDGVRRKNFSEKNSKGIEINYQVQAGASTKFFTPPIFHGCQLHQDTIFERAEFPVTEGQESAARAYRTLKLAFAQQQSIREEQRFFKLEMVEEAKAAENNGDRTRWLYVIYRKFSDFGFSVGRPLYVLLTATIFALFLYAWQADLVFCTRSIIQCSKTAPLLQFSFASAIPGFEKLAEPAAIELFGKSKEGTANVGVLTVITLLLHKAISILSLFLIGLALRNLFKMK